jgi:hypothetical protein
MPDGKKSATHRIFDYLQQNPARLHRLIPHPLPAATPPTRHPPLNPIQPNLPIIQDPIKHLLFHPHGLRLTDKKQPTIKLDKIPVPKL